MNWWIAPIVAATVTTGTALLLSWQARPGVRDRIMELRAGKPRPEVRSAPDLKPTLKLAAPFIKWGEHLTAKAKGALHNLDLRAARAGLMIPSGYLAVITGLVSLLGGIIGWQSKGMPLSLLTLVIGAATGPLVLFWLLSTSAKRRRSQIMADLPDLVDLLAVAAEAGSGLDGAIRRVAIRFKGPIRDELERFLDEVRLGTPRVEALQRLAERWDSEEATAFTGALIQAMERGTGLAQTLKIQAKSMRSLAHQAAREKAMKLPTKMMVPMALFMLPALLLVVMGPAMLQFIGSNP